MHAPATLVMAPGDPIPIPVPAGGSFLLTQAPGTVLSDKDGDAVRPVGSVAKTMTALVVLAAHPLGAGEDGPVLTMTSADVKLYDEAIAEQGSALAVHIGESLSERQLLLALLLPSANNVAETLARWVSGSRDAFVTLLNQRAAELGMSHTHFDDPSGISDATVSTAHDLVLLAGSVLDNPALAQLVSTREATLPDGTRLANLDILLGVEPGWLGVKTGWTPRAGGCLLFAASRTYASGTRPVVVIGAVLAQPALATADPDHPELGGALRVARAAASAALGNIVAVDVSTVAPRVSGSVSTPWMSNATVMVGRVGPRYVVVRRGAAVALTTSLSQPSPPLRRGSLVGIVTGVGADGLTIAWPLNAGGDVEVPSAWWKLFNA